MFTFQDPVTEHAKALINFHDYTFFFLVVVVVFVIWILKMVLSFVNFEKNLILLDDYFFVFDYFSILNKNIVCIFVYIEFIIVFFFRLILIFFLNLLTNLPSYYYYQVFTFIFDVYYILLSLFEYNSSLSILLRFNLFNNKSYGYLYSVGKKFGFYNYYRRNRSQFIDTAIYYRHKHRLITQALYPQEYLRVFPFRGDPWRSQADYLKKFIYLEFFFFFIRRINFNYLYSYYFLKSSFLFFGRKKQKRFFFFPKFVGKFFFGGVHTLNFSLYNLLGNTYSNPREIGPTPKFKYKIFSNFVLPGAYSSNFYLFDAKIFPYLFFKNVRHRRNLEWIWTGIPTLILLFILYPSIVMLYTFDRPYVTKPYLTFKALGHQWYW
jgi:Cytochrome C oxidase subunit II, transmembrane domain